jgi:hypothetical protein
VALAIAAALLGSCGSGGNGSADHTPPQFGGLLSATTCAAGPGRITSRFTLRWHSAIDDRTSRNQLAYEIYRSTKPSIVDAREPAYSASPGAISFVTPPLRSDERWFFTVRARDAVGNLDHNRVEREGENLCR